MAEYHSQYTGEQIDEAVRRVLNGEWNGGELCDSFRFCDFYQHPTNYGNNGKDDEGNDLTPFTVLPYLPKYSITPPSRSILPDSNTHISIIDKFANLIPGETIGNNRYILAEISMPSLLYVPHSAFLSCNNLVAANFPSCMEADIEAFDDCVALESLTLNSGCIIRSGTLSSILAADNRKIFRLYLRGSLMGTCSIDVFGVFFAPDSAEVYAYEGSTIPGLEIYVPPALLNDFKTEWAGGAFANNIFPLPDE